MAPAPLIDWLDRYIDAMVQTIIAHAGTVLRFIGDGILAVFGAPVPRRNEGEIDRTRRMQCAVRWRWPLRCAA
jgi:adenylate cyclase